MIPKEADRKRATPPQSPTKVTKCLLAAQHLPGMGRGRNSVGVLATAARVDGRGGALRCGADACGAGRDPGRPSSACPRRGAPVGTPPPIRDPPRAAPGLAAVPAKVRSLTGSGRGSLLPVVHAVPCDR